MKLKMCPSKESSITIAALRTLSQYFSLNNILSKVQRLVGSANKKYNHLASIYSTSDSLFIISQSYNQHLSQFLITYKYNKIQISYHAVLILTRDKRNISSSVIFYFQDIYRLCELCPLKSQIGGSDLPRPLFYTSFSDAQSFRLISSNQQASKSISSYEKMISAKFG